jgi:hypothetical protein
MSTAISVPEGWGVKPPEFSVKLKDGKPEGATSWFDVSGRPVVKVGNTWKLQRQKPAPPKKLSPEEVAKRGGRDAQPRQPKTSSGGDAKLTPQEAEHYSKFLEPVREKLKEGSRASFYPDPEQSRQDMENRKRKYAPYAALSEDQLSSVGAYTTQWDMNMNSLLRTGKIEKSAGQQLGSKLTPSETQVRKAISDLTSALESLPNAPAGVFHRAVSGSLWKEDGLGRDASPFMKQLQSLEPGDTIDDPGFSSFTSGGAPVIDRFLKGDPDSDQNVVFEVESDKMKNISPISGYEQEKEHMLPPGAKFRVVGKSEGLSRNAGKHTIIKLQQI